MSVAAATPGALTQHILPCRVSSKITYLCFPIAMLVVQISTGMSRQSPGNQLPVVLLPDCIDKVLYICQYKLCSYVSQ